MKATRRDFLHFATTVTAVGVNPRLARAESYPTHPVRIISGFPPGGISDTYARYPCTHPDRGDGCRKMKKFPAGRFHNLVPALPNVWRDREATQLQNS